MTVPLFDSGASDLLVIGVALCLLAAAINGYNDSGNIVATIISSGSLRARPALFLAAIAEFAGPFLFGGAVAASLARDLIDPGAITPEVLIAALVSTVIWSIAAGFLGSPTSASHALIGSLTGAALAMAGTQAVEIAGLSRIMLALLISPILGGFGGFLLLRLVLFLTVGVSPSINRPFRRGQVLASVALGVSHGANNSQKALGVLILVLVANSVLGPDQPTPFWALSACALAFSLGTALGGWRTIRTLGMKLYRVRPIHGFSSQSAATLVILLAALLGGPVSTTHVVASAIIGAGAADRPSKVRWLVAYGIGAAWLVTLPGSAITAALITLGLLSL